MLGWSISFLLVALIAGAIGFGGVAGAAVGMAQLLFGLFVIMFIGSVLVSVFRS